MNFKYFSAVIALTLGSTAVMADSYRAEIGATYQKIDFDSFGDADALYAEGKLFFENVNTNRKPLAESAFLQKSSNLSLQHLRIDFDGDTASGTELGLEYYFADTIFYAGANVSTFEDPSGDSEDDWGVTLGVTPLAGWLLTTGYADSDEDYELNLNSKYVTELGSEMAINVELGYADSGDLDDEYFAGADFYFNKKFSLGAFSITDEETGYGVRSRLFFIDSLSAEASYYTYDNSDSVSIGVKYRF